MHPSHIMTQREIIRKNLNKSDWEITKDKCDSTRAHRRHLAANGKHENKRKVYCTNIHLRIIEILITLVYKLSAVTAAVTAGRRCSLWGWRKGVPGGGAFHPCEGRLRSGAPPPPTARPLGGLLGSATHVLWARACGCGGPTLSPWPARPVRGCVPWGGWGAVSVGGWPATVVRGVWCQALSLPRPPVLWGGQPGYRDPGVPGAVGANVGTQHRFHSVRPCGPALLPVGMAEAHFRGGCLPPL